MVLGFREAPLVGEYLPHVRIGLRRAGGVAGALPARSGLLIQLDRLRPAALPVCKSAKVVEHVALVRRVSEFPIDVERTRRVGRLVGPPQLEQRPIERVRGTGLGAELPDLLPFSERFAAK